MKKKHELLVPVGNYESLIAAINNGADAVYLGGKKFGARAFANNFTEEDLEKAIQIFYVNKRYKCFAKNMRRGIKQKICNANFT